MSNDFIYLQSILSDVHRKWRHIFLLSIILASSVFLGSHLLKPLYQAESSFLTFAPKSDFTLGGDSGGNLQSVVGALIGGGASSGGSEAFMGVLYSRSLAERVLQSENLVDAFLPSVKENEGQVSTPSTSVELTSRSDERVESAAGILLTKNLVVIKDKRFPIIRIQATHSNPQIAARIANAYLRELQNYINTNSLTAATKHRRFVEDLFKESKIQALTSGKNLNQFFEKYRASDVSAKLDVSLEDLGLRYSQSKEANAPNLSQEKLDIVQLRQRFPGLKSSTEFLDKKNDVIRGVPQKHVYEYLRMEQDILNSMVSFLSTQFQLAKMQESREGLSFQILDPASVPQSKTFPRPGRYALITFFLSWIISILYLGVKTSRKELESRTISVVKG